MALRSTLSSSGRIVARPARVYPQGHPAKRRCASWRAPHRGITGWGGEMLVGGGLRASPPSGIPPMAIPHAY